MNRKKFEESKNLLANLLLSQARFNRVGDSLTPNNFKEIFTFLPEDVGESVLNFGNKLLDEKIIDTASELLTAAYDYVEKGTENGLFGGEINYDTSRHNTDDDKQ